MSKAFPNWRKYDDYPPLEASNMKAWAWEFLRRNGSYREDYKNFKKAEIDLKGLPRTLRLRGDIDYEDYPLDPWKCFPAAKPGETYGKYLGRVGYRSYRILRRDRAIQEDWYLTTPADPDLALQPSQVKFIEPERVYFSKTLIPNAPDLVAVFLRHDEALLRVSLSSDIDEQLSQLKQKLRAKAREWKSYIYGFPLWWAFHLMLRYWDAQADAHMWSGKKFELSRFKSVLESDAALHDALCKARYANRNRDLINLKANTLRGGWDEYLRRLIKERGYVQLTNFRPKPTIRRRPHRLKSRNL